LPTWANRLEQFVSLGGDWRPDTSTYIDLDEEDPLAVREGNRVSVRNVVDHIARSASFESGNRR
jgi:hypothetical protein